MPVRRDVDLSTKDGTIAKLIYEHFDEIKVIETKSELIEKMTKLLEEAKLETPGSKLFMLNLSKTKGDIDALTYVINSALSVTVDPKYGSLRMGK